jgi:hypothetical protein
MTVSYKCHNFAELVGNKLNMCNGTHWLSPPQCLCPLPDDSLIVSVTPVDTAPSTSSFKCKYGLERIGPEEAACNATIGEWNELPECVCPLPGKKDSRITLERMNETAATFVCEDSSTGNGIITCNIRDDGIEWTSPVCQCKLPEQIANGYYIKLTESNLQFKCNFAYQLIGAEYATCNYDGYEWTEIPKCT